MPFNFQPKTKQEIEESKLHPEGDFRFKCIKAEDKVTPNGKSFKNLTLRTYDITNKERILFDALWEDAIEKIMCFCECGELVEEYKNGELPDSSCTKVEGTVRVIKKPATDKYPARNFVIYLPNVVSPPGFNPSEDISF